MIKQTTSNILSVGMFIIIVSAIINLMGPLLANQSVINEQVGEIASLYRKKSEITTTLATLDLYKDIVQAVRTQRSRLAAGETMPAPPPWETAITETLTKSLKNSKSDIRPVEGNIGEVEGYLKDQLELLSQRVAEVEKRSDQTRGAWNFSHLIQVLQLIVAVLALRVTLRSGV